MGLFQSIKSSLRTFIHRRYRWPGMDIRLSGGQQLHLVGSIHMGTRDMSPLPPALIAKIQHADALIVEADISGSETPFNDLPEYAPLKERLTAEQFQQLEKLAEETGVSLALSDRQPLWQVAMILQAMQAQQLGLRPQYGIDYQMLHCAREANLPITELEGADSQIALLKELPDNGRVLLEDTLTHWHTNARLLQMMIGWWMEHPPEAAPSLPNTFSHSLYDLLMHQRNLAWQQKLQALPPGRYVVAVGALHLYGEGNLPSMLKARQT